MIPGIFIVFQNGVTSRYPSRASGRTVAPTHTAIRCLPFSA